MYYIVYVIYIQVHEVGISYKEILNIIGLPLE